MLNKSQFYLSNESFMLRAGQNCPVKPELPSFQVCEGRVSFVLGEGLEFASGAGVMVTVKEEAIRGALKGLQFLDKLSQEELDSVVQRIRSIDLAHKDDGKVPLKYTAVQVADFSEYVDGLADVVYVAIGSLVAAGVPDLPLLELVADNNLLKFGPGGYKDERGKWIKPKDHKKPDFVGLLYFLGAQVKDVQARAIQDAIIAANQDANTPANQTETNTTLKAITGV